MSQQWSGALTFGPGIRPLVLLGPSEAVPTCVSRQLSGNAHVALTGLQAVYRTDIVQASTGHVIPRGGVGACHHPGRAQRDGMHLWAGGDA